ncbi:hypothetical protein [Streptomyces sp. CoT10]|uniref:hypothetical protein n=1 Tax=Streptomyces sp. CoT10 TaxID=2875762 RepID=UPI001CD37E1A|nr:hypothetical protein [Streptomyces sp. CoT10]
MVGGHLAQVVQVEFVVGQQPQCGLVVVGRGKGGRGRVKPVGDVVLVADPGEFERVQRGECVGDRGAGVCELPARVVSALTRRCWQ